MPRELPRLSFQGAERDAGVRLERWVAAQKDGGHILKVETKRELEVTFAATGGAAFSRHFAEGGTGRVEIHTGAVVVDPVGMIDEVERFGAELEAGAFGDRKFLE